MENTNTTVNTTPLTFTNLKDANPYVTGASPVNKTATAWEHRKTNGNLNKRAKNYRYKEGKNLSGTGSSRND